jgi:cbb3-type cytochrome c oxidase subunit III
MKDPSRLYRWTLLAASLVTVAYLVAAAVRENYLADWQKLQHAYRNVLQAKATDERGRELLSNFHIELKQISVPSLNAVDRCVSCHSGIDDPRMIDVPNPLRVHPGDILKNHPADRFGCTVCHHGQGPATNFHDAKADTDDVYWDYPLLKGKLSEASCLACHDVARLPGEQVALLRGGMELYRRKSCGSCHKLGGRGGTLGPALDNEGAKTRHQLIMTNLEPPRTTERWQLAHFRDPPGVIPNSQMRNPSLTRQEALALTVYMLSLWQRDVPESYLAPDKIGEKYRDLHRAPLAGAQTYQQYCFGCHGQGTYGSWNKAFKRFIPAVRGPSLLATATPKYLETNITRGRPGTQMPPWGREGGGLQPEEITALVAYLRSEAPPPVPPGPPVARGDVKRGGVLFAQNCVGCHGVGGRGGMAPEIGNPTFQEAASDDFIVTTIRHGRIATAMPAFQRAVAPDLTDAEIGDLLAYIRSLGQPSSEGGLKQARADTAGQEVRHE